MVFLEADIRPTQVKKTQRKIYLYHRGNLEKMQDLMTEYANEYVDRDKSGILVNELWKEFRNKINNMIEKYTPSLLSTKTKKGKTHLPWYKKRNQQT